MRPRSLGIAALVVGVALLVSAAAVGPAEPARSDRTDALPAATYLAVPPVATAGVAPIPPGYRVAIARLKVDLPIAEGVISRDVDLQRTPEGYAFHLPGSAIPGQPGNTYLYSHARVGMFLPLWDARVGDQVIVTTPDGATLAYAVSEIRPKVPPSDVSVAQPTADERLTLQTSTGPDPGDPRFVVIAVPAR